ncbi:MAG: PrgI family protein [Micromonosporaceae bacterium]|nr:PrgI family protein [Micromonosporaceae bacterium]
MPRRDTEAPMRARIPSDIERPDTIIFGLNARQIVILTVTGLLIYTAWTALATTVQPLVFAGCALPVAAGAFFLAVARRDGLPLDAWLLAAWRHRRSPHRLVPAEGMITPAPAWVSTTLGPGDRVPLPAPLRLPARGITEQGMVDLGPDGAVALVDASTVAFGLRTASEQNALISGFARWLHALDAPTQILVRAQRVDLADLACRIEAQAPGLPHPALEDAARSHAEFLENLAGSRELLRRQVTIAVSDPRSSEHSLHRATEAVRALSACEVTARVCDPDAAAQTLSECLNPGTAPSRSMGVAGRATGPVPMIVPADTEGW